MWQLKLIGAAMILIGSTILGLEKSKKEENKIRTLQDINYMKELLCQIFICIYPKNCPNHITDFLKGCVRKWNTVGEELWNRYGESGWKIPPRTG